MAADRSSARDPGPAPVDPRADWSLPAFGTMARVEPLDDTVTRVLADNASPMTLDGTNTYVVGVAGTGEVAIIDPGPDDRDHLARVEQEIARRDAGVRAIVVTHHHLDHAAAAHAWAQRFGVPAWASDRHVASAPDATLTDGSVVALAGLTIEAVATPGHTRDHLALRLGTGALLTGDHVLGRGTSVVAHPDGDLEAYLASLHRVLALGPDVLYPGHGPALTEDPGAVVRYYLDHRAFRERQILEVLVAGPTTPRQLVAVIYAAVDQRLWGAAEASTRATVQALATRGIVRVDPSDRVHLVPG
jgi:glyoxylase-like metal-dependent hydrolase (beta-lactamase superfamily II)